ncbi:hypothetical protein GVAV_003142 [Gurleya vavrai]
MNHSFIILCFILQRYNCANQYKTLHKSYYQNNLVDYCVQTQTEQQHQINYNIRGKFSQQADNIVINNNESSNYPQKIKDNGKEYSNALSLNNFNEEIQRPSENSKYLGLCDLLEINVKDLLLLPLDKDIYDKLLLDVKSQEPASLNLDNDKRCTQIDNKTFEINQGNSEFHPIKLNHNSVDLSKKSKILSNRVKKNINGQNQVKNIRKRASSLLNHQSNPLFNRIKILMKGDKFNTRKCFLALYNYNKKIFLNNYSKFLFENKFTVDLITFYNEFIFTKRSCENYKVIDDANHVDFINELTNQSSFDSSDLNIAVDFIKITSNLCHTCKETNNSDFCDIKMLKIINGIENATIKYLFDKDDFFIVFKNIYDKIHIENIKIFVRNEKKLNNLLLIKFNEQNTNFITVFDTNCKNENAFLNIKNVKIKNFIMFFQNDIENVIDRICRCFEYFDLDFDIVYQIIFEVYVLKKIHLYDFGITKQDYLEFLYCILNNFDQKIYFYQPGIKFLFDYLNFSKIEISAAICTKFLFFGITFCFLINSIIKNGNDFEVLNQFYIFRINLHSDLKKSMINIRNIDLFFSKILIYCIYQFKPHKKSVSFIQQYVTFDLTLLWFLNKHHHSKQDLLADYFYVIKRYKFISKFIFFEEIEFDKLFKINKNIKGFDLYEFYYVTKKEFNFYYMLSNNSNLIYSNKLMYKYYSKMQSLEYILNNSSQQSKTYFKKHSFYFWIFKNVHREKFIVEFFKELLNNEKKEVEFSNLLQFLDHEYLWFFTKINF